MQCVWQKRMGWDGIGWDGWHEMAWVDGWLECGMEGRRDIYQAYSGIRPHTAISRGVVSSWKTSNCVGVSVDSSWGLSGDGGIPQLCLAIRPALLCSGPWQLRWCW